MKFTNREIDILKKLYPKYQHGEISMETMCKVFNRTADSLRSAAQRYGLVQRVEKDTINEDLLKQILEVHMV